MNAKAMRERTQAALAKRQDKQAQACTEAYEAAVSAIAKAADNGESGITYRGYLPAGAIRQLKAEGYKLRDLGESVASIMEISW